MSTKTNKREAVARDRPVQGLSVSTQRPRPGYFVVRKMGQVVPLVAVDELPPGVDLIGVPRNLDLVETGGMLNLGLQEGAPPGAPDGGGFYGLVGLEEDEYEDEDRAVGSSGSDTAVSSPLILPIRFSTLTTATNTKSQATKSHSPPGLSTSVHAPSRSTTSTLGTQQQGQQQTCRHWCTHNRRCKWAENCRYKHEMPRTRFELGLIGLSDWPGWFKAENLGFFPGYGRGIGRGVERLRDLDMGGGMERKERKERERGSSRVERETERGSSMGVLEGERVLERLREMEKLLRGKVIAGQGRDEKKTDAKIKEEKRIREKEKEKLNERERMRIEKAREREASNRIDRGDLEGTRKWEDESEEDSDYEGKNGGGNKKVLEQVEKSKGSNGGKEKLVDI